jgi:hypothetical protein
MFYLIDNLIVSTFFPLKAETRPNTSNTLKTFFSDKLKS